MAAQIKYIDIRREKKSNPYFTEINDKLIEYDISVERIINIETLKESTRVWYQKDKL